MTIRHSLLAALVAAVLAWAPLAHALTLADLDAGGSFNAGGLLFDHFDVTTGGDLDPNLANYIVSVLADGFSIAGPISTLATEFGGLLVTYQVSAPTAVIDGATLVAVGETIGQGAQAFVTEAMLGPIGEVLGTMLAFDIEGVGSDSDDSLGFAAPVNRVFVTKAVTLGGGESAAMPLIVQTFSAAVGEPPALAIGGFGLVALWIFGRRRQSVM